MPHLPGIAETIQISSERGNLLKGPGCKSKSLVRLEWLKTPFFGRIYPVYVNCCSTQIGKLMKNNRDISSLNGLRINGQSCLLQTLCPYRDRQQWAYQKAFLTAEGAKKSQRPQRGNYPCRENGIFASTRDSLQMSISVGGLSRARFHRRLETPPTIYFKRRVKHLLCEIATLQQDLCKR